MEKIKNKIIELRYISQLLNKKLSEDIVYISNGNILPIEDKYLIADAMNDIEDIANLFAYLENKL